MSDVSSVEILTQMRYKSLSLFGDRRRIWGSGVEVSDVGRVSLASNLAVANGFASVRKKFLLLSVTALAILGTSMGISFTADTGVTQITAASTGGALPLVWSATYGTAGGLPVAVTGVATAGWKYGTSGTGLQSVPTVPGWPVVVAGQAGSVSSAGDIAVIDATDTSATYLLVTIYVTNMRPLALTYNSYSLPIRIYGSTAFSSGAITWSATPVVDSNGINLATTYLTNTQGFETFKLPTGAGKYYAITLDAGGSYYPYQTGASGSATTPALYITAQRTS